MPFLWGSLFVPFKEIVYANLIFVSFEETVQVNLILHFLETNQKE